MAQVDPTGVTATSGTPSTPRSAGPRTVSLGGGLVVAYPDPANDAASRIGRANRRTGTKPEVMLRSALHRHGLRFRVDHPLRLGDVRVRPDIVFTRWRVAVFVDGCFWHQCPDHGGTPKRNSEYWIPKLRRNVDWDGAVDAALEDGDWTVVRVWEHENVTAAAGLILALIKSQRLSCG